MVMLCDTAQHHAIGPHAFFPQNRRSGFIDKQRENNDQKKSTAGKTKDNFTFLTKIRVCFRVIYRLNMTTICFGGKNGNVRV
jgi:hypothetical protein